MAEAESATTLAPRLGVSRQKLNYHFPELEREGFVEGAEQPQRREEVPARDRVLSCSYQVFTPGRRRSDNAPTKTATQYFKENVMTDRPKATREQRHEIAIAASPEAVWKAITDAEELTRWFVE